MDERIYGKGSCLRRGTVAAVAAAAVVLAAGAGAVLLTQGDDKNASQPGDPKPGPDIGDPDTDFLTGQPPTAQLLDGVWRVDNGTVLLQFKPDGTVTLDDQGTLFSHPATRGTYAINGGTVTVTTTQDTNPTCAGTTYTMRASVASPGSVRFISSPAGFGSCSPMPIGRGALERLLPSSGKVHDDTFAADVKDWQPLSDKTIVYGVWVAEGGRHILEMDADGSYFVADSSKAVVDNGRWVLDKRTLSLTSAGSSTCNKGDALVLSSLEYGIPGTTVFRGTVTQNACRVAWAPAVWALFPDANHN